MHNGFAPLKENLPEQSVILSEQSESKDLRTYVPAYGQIGAKIPRLGFASLGMTRRSVFS